MARRSSFVSLIQAAARDAARRQRQLAAEQRRLEAEQSRRRREAERERLHLEKVARMNAREAEREEKRRYLEKRQTEASDLNQELADTIAQLTTILEHTLKVDDMIAFDSLRIKEDFRSLEPPKKLLKPHTPPVQERFLARATRPTFMAALMPGAKNRYQRELQAAQAAFDEAQRDHQKAEDERKSKLATLQAEYEAEKSAFLAKATQRNQEVDALEVAYAECEASAVVAYNTMVLERSEYPQGFPQAFRLAYNPESKELLIEYELPGVETVPEEAEFKYVKTRDVIENKRRKLAEVKEIYQDLVAAICLRTIHEVTEADQGQSLDTVVFNGFVQTCDPATGKDIRPHLISVRTTRAAFAELNLARVDKKACLRNLGAQVSPRPEEQQAVKPVVEFDMVDKRFVEQSDVLGDLESRPNLMELNPFEFENLVSNLFTRMGLDTKQTRSSKDGGVDAVAFDTRPVLGGKVVIQAKRYKHHVGVSAVRDLYGTMMNEGANKGILVTTSHYGPDAHDFASAKPIELIDGGALLYLLGEVGIKARIVFPSES